MVRFHISSSQILDKYEVNIRHAEGRTIGEARKTYVYLYVTMIHIKCVYIFLLTTQNITHLFTYTESKASIICKIHNLYSRACWAHDIGYEYYSSPEADLKGTHVHNCI